MVIEMAMDGILLTSALWLPILANGVEHLRLHLPVLSMPASYGMVK